MSNTTQPTTPIAWFELPVRDLDRATRFYETVFAISLRREHCGGYDMAIFPFAEGQPGGALAAMPQLEPRDNGTLIYLHGGNDLTPVLARAIAAGGKEVLAKTDLGGDIGHIAIFVDCEGNRVGLYSPH
jgi:predicted enzyme related to lactoylglutathione lyase